MQKLTLLLCLLFAQTTFAQVDTIGCGSPDAPVFLPDNAVFDLTIPILGVSNNDLSHPGQGVCGVRLSFDHEYVGDLTFVLTSPAGQSVELVGPTGFYGSTDFSTWDIAFVRCDSTANPDPGFPAIWGNNQPWGMFGVFTGTYYPAQGCLNDFNTGPVNGIWTIRVMDSQSIDVGNVYAAELFFCDPAGQVCYPCNLYPEAGLVTTVLPDGWTVALADTSTGATRYDVLFGDGQAYSGFSAPFEHVYADTGDYTIRWIATNGCNSDTVMQPVHISGSLPVADFDVSPVCPGGSPAFTILTADHVNTWHWLLPGATPSESFDQYPFVVYPNTGLYDVWLEVTNNLGADTIFKPLVVTVAGPPPPVAQFDWIQDGAQVQLTNTSIGATGILWYLPDGTMSSDSVVRFDVLPGLSYEVLLLVENQCGVATASQTIQVDAIPPLPDFYWIVNNICPPFSVQFVDISGNSPDSWQWSFEGGTPTVSSEANPVIIFQQPGFFAAHLTVANSAGSASSTNFLFLDAPLPVEPAFTAVVGNGTISTTNLSQNAIGFAWLLNGVLASTGFAPVFEVDSSGAYTVTLFAWNECDTDSTSQVFQVVISGTKDPGAFPLRAGIHPNPTSGAFWLEIESEAAIPTVWLEIFDATGRKVQEKNISVPGGEKKEFIDLGMASAGLYALRIRTTDGEKTLRFVVQR